MVEEDVEYTSLSNTRRKRAGRHVAAGRRVLAIGAHRYNLYRPAAHRSLIRATSGKEWRPSRVESRGKLATGQAELKQRLVSKA